MVALPYKKSDLSKKRQVEEMFDNISPKYDLLNHLLSINIDKIWRKRTIKKLASFSPAIILDIATGTADFAIAAVKQLKSVSITGIDISQGMLDIGQKKIEKNGLENNISLIKADSENLPFENDAFDSGIVGFGVRNFENLELGLQEIYRVLKPGGVFFVLEFSKPIKFPFKQLYYFYFLKVLPFIGRLISKDKRAYTYLPESVNAFPDGDSFLEILKKVGFIKCSFETQTFGVASIYQSEKPKI